MTDYKKRKLRSLRSKNLRSKFLPELLYDYSNFLSHKKSSARALDYENAPHSHRMIQVVAISYHIKKRSLCESK